MCGPERQAGKLLGCLNGLTHVNSMYNCHFVDKKIRLVVIRSRHAERGGRGVIARGSELSK